MAGELHCGIGRGTGVTLKQIKAGVNAMFHRRRVASQAWSRQRRFNARRPRERRPAVRATPPVAALPAPDLWALL